MNDTELDQQYLAIKKRSTSELFDLTLVVVRSDGFRILFWLAVFAAPLALINHVAASWLCNRFLLLDPEDGDWSFMYVISVLALTVFETPFASSLSIIYLGKRVFSAGGVPKTGEILLAWIEAVPQLILFTVLLVPLGIFYECMPEIVALERSPLFARRKDQITTFRRLRNFHRNRFGEQFVMLYPILLFGVMLVPGLLLVISCLFYLCIGPVQNYFSQFVALAAAIVVWVSCFFLIVFHFLRYLDMRIEREGWDVELVFRAERSRSVQ